MVQDTEELSTEQLRYRCSEDDLQFDVSGEASSLPDLPGQERALRALDFGISMDQEGYNIYATGERDSMRLSDIGEQLEKHAETLPVPDDWFYVQDFSQDHKARCLSLPAGKGADFRKDMEQLVEELKRDVPQALESEDYENERNRIVQEVTRKRNAEFAEMEEKAEKEGFSMKRNPSGVIIVPMIDGEPANQEQLNDLPEQKKSEIEKKGTEIEKTLRKIMQNVQEIEKEGQNKIKELERNVAMSAVGHLIDEIKERYKEHKKITEYLEDVSEDVIGHVNEFRSGGPDSQNKAQIPDYLSRTSRKQTGDISKRYSVNLIVDNSDKERAPVITETNPTYQRLTGRVERQVRLGALITDFTMIKPGALHRANGGFLLMETEDILQRPYAYRMMKRVLKDGEIRITDLGEEVSLITTVSIEPDPIPLNVKVVLAGSPILYYLLDYYDKDFAMLFRVQADFDTEMERNDDAAGHYIRFLNMCSERENIPQFSPGGAARMIEYGVELAGDKKKISARFDKIRDIALQAAHWAGQNGHETITDRDVQKALDEKIYRSNRIELKIREMIERKKIFISTEQETEGQVNGLSVIQLGDYTFGRPSRITAQTFMGKKGIVNIEREIEMSGPVHNKGVMILSGYLNGTYGRNMPVSLSAQITFEQTYEGVEGDSASSAELYALLSSLSGFPLKQGIAVTGSVNQKGGIQPIGGVNKKIEGFFEVCRASGLTGDHGVLVPQANIANIMLRQEVVDAVERGEFHVYPVNTIDRGIEILTGRKAGERKEDGSFPENTVNRAVQKKLKTFSRALKEYEYRDTD